jgi:heme/copper-type cytochrome/quinol oxidase subunit 3
MSEASAATANDHTTSTGISSKKLMMWLFLGSDCMFFGTLISTHLIYRKLYPNPEPLPTEIFDIDLTTISSFILLMSSFLMALAVSAMHKGHLNSYRRMVSGVILFGLIFLGFQVYEFSHFVHHADFTIHSGTFGSTFYLLTGTHGCHVAIGVLILLSQLIASFTGKLNLSNAVDVETAGLYWHFVDIVWIIILPPFTSWNICNKLGLTMSDIPLPKDQLDKEEKHFFDFFYLAIILSFVTMIEVIIIGLPFVQGFLFWSLVVLSLAKFFAVVLIFMHLVYDKMLYTLLFMAGLILATGTVWALSMLFSPARVDTDALSRYEPASNVSASTIIA